MRYKVLLIVVGILAMTSIAAYAQAMVNVKGIIPFSFEDLKPQNPLIFIILVNNKEGSLQFPIHCFAHDKMATKIYSLIWKNRLGVAYIRVRGFLHPYRYYDSSGVLHNTFIVRVVSVSNY